MTVQRFVQLKQVIFSKTFKIWVKCCDSAFNLLFYLPCGGEASFRERCVKFASLTAGDRVLDVCCGTGELTVVIENKDLQDNWLE